MNDQAALLPGESPAREAEALLRAAHHRFDSADIDRALELLADALQSLDTATAQPPPAGTTADYWQLRLRQARATRLNNCSAAYAIRYRHHGDPDDLNDAIDTRRASLDAASPSDSSTSRYWSRLASLLRLRFAADHDDADLTESLIAARTALHTADAASIAAARSALAQALRIRYEHHGDAASLNESITLARQAAADTKPGNTTWGGYHNNLSICLRDRFLLNRHRDDLEEAITSARYSVAAPTEGAGRSARMANLAAALRSRYIAATRDFSVQVDTTDINEAVGLYRQALETAPPARHGWRSAALASALLTRYDSARDQRDLVEAIELARAAVADKHCDRYDLALRTNDLGYALAQAGAATGDLDAATHAVAMATDAVSMLTAQSPNRAMFLDNLGLAYGVCFDISGDKDAWRSAVAVWQNSATSSAGTTMDRIRAARRWADFAETTAPGSSTALVGYTTALDLLPRLAWSGIDRASQEAVLAEVAPLTGAAVAAAVQRNDPERALQAHEQGRAVLWSQLLELRADLNGLEKKDPTTAARLRQLATALDSPPGMKHLHPGTPLTTPPHNGGHRLETALGPVTHDVRMDWAQEWDMLVAHVRTGLDGFDDFLRPLPTHRLLAAAADGPIVVVNVSERRCDALLVTTTGVRTCPLPKLTQTDATEKLTLYLAALRTLDRAVHALVDARSATSLVSDRSTSVAAYRASTAVEGARADADTMLTDILDWLWDTVAEPVTDALQNPESSPGLQRLWWCPTGPLALLPLHAAGHHDGSDRTVLENYICSYTPTVRALVHSRAQRPTATRDRKTLLVAPTSSRPDRAVSNNTWLHAATRPELLSTLTGPAATRNATLAALTDHPIVHFNCHGDQDLDNPSHGGLELSDTTLSILDIAANPHRGDFAGLAACKTAAGGEDLANESITLAAALHYTGYRHVVGTLWSVRDRDADDVFTDLYRELTRSGGFDESRTAAALRQATQMLRDSTSSPHRWANFIHIGP